MDLVISNISSYPGGFRALQRTGYVEDRLMNIWELLEGYKTELPMSTEDDEDLEGHQNISINCSDQKSVIPIDLTDSLIHRVK